ncbi:hypothetical protein C100_12045 [Sphingobium sp. C100]|nr:hypothetical protein C100_12045 [Sphingobium sp. C100]
MIVSSDMEADDGQKSTVPALVLCPVRPID